MMVDCVCMHNYSVNQTVYITTCNHLAVYSFLFNLSKFAGYRQTFPLAKQIKQRAELSQ